MFKIFHCEKCCDFWNVYEKSMSYTCYEHIPYTISSAAQRGYGREPSDIFQKGSLKGSAPYLYFFCIYLFLAQSFRTFWDLSPHIKQRVVFLKSSWFSSVSLFSLFSCVLWMPSLISVSLLQKTSTASAPLCKNSWLVLSTASAKSLSWSRMVCALDNCRP